MEELQILVAHLGSLLTMGLGAMGGITVVWAGTVQWVSSPGPKRQERVRELLIWAGVFLLIAIVVFVSRTRVVGWLWG